MSNWVDSPSKFTLIKISRGRGAIAPWSKTAQEEILSRGKARAVGGGFESSQGDRSDFVVAAQYLLRGLN